MNSIFKLLLQDIPVSFNSPRFLRTLNPQGQWPCVSPQTFRFSMWAYCNFSKCWSSEEIYKRWTVYIKRWFFVLIVCKIYFMFKAWTMKRCKNISLKWWAKQLRRYIWPFGIFSLLYLQITWNFKLVHSVTEILSIYPLIWNLQFELETVFPTAQQLQYLGKTSCVAIFLMLCDCTVGNTSQQHKKWFCSSL